MKTAITLFEQGEHRWRVIARDPNKRTDLIDTNEYLISHGDQLLLTDPGGLEIFPAVFAALAEVADVRSLQYLFSSHQDPDIISSLALWLEVNPAMKCYASWLWTSFLPHFGGSESTFIAIPDEGMEIPLGGLALRAIPAHYLHSSGNFCLYDERSRLFFSGDIGAALLPAGADIFVSDFDAHIRHAEGFHRRWMPSNEAKRRWCERVSQLDIDLLCPQHGAIYQGGDVERFINWFDELRVGVTADEGY